MEQQLENVTSTKSNEEQHLNLQKQVQQPYPTEYSKDKSNSKQKWNNNQLPMKYRTTLRAYGAEINNTHNIQRY